VKISWTAPPARRSSAAARCTRWSRTRYPKATRWRRSSAI